MIYFVQRGKKGPIKIGHTRGSAKTRLVTLQLASYVKLRLLAATTGARCHERLLHERFAADRIRGEWFKATPELRALIKTLPPVDVELDDYVYENTHLLRHSWPFTGVTLQDIRPDLHPDLYPPEPWSAL